MPIFEPDTSIPEIRKCYRHTDPLVGLDILVGIKFLTPVMNGTPGIQTLACHNLTDLTRI
jgi:hypothetical protein